MSLHLPEGDLEDDKGVGRGRGKGLNYMIRETFMLTDLMISFCNAF